MPIGVGLRRNRARSKQELQRELELPRGPIHLRDETRRGADVGAIENDLSGVREIGVIENIEGFRPELQKQFLVDLELLEQRGVDVNQAWTPQRPARNVPESPLSRYQKGMRIE